MWLVATELDHTHLEICRPFRRPVSFMFDSDFNSFYFLNPFVISHKGYFLGLVSQVSASKPLFSLLPEMAFP